MLKPGGRGLFSVQGTGEAGVEEEGGQQKGPQLLAGERPRAACGVSCGEGRAEAPGRLALGVLGCNLWGWLCSAPVVARKGEGVRAEDRVRLLGEGGRLPASSSRLHRG